MPKKKVVQIIDTPVDTLYVFADIETDTLKVSKLLQIAAVVEKDSKTFKFCAFINPGEPLAQGTTNLLGFYFYKGQLYREGGFLPSTSITRALNDFKVWLVNLKKPVALVFHNGFCFDCNILARLFVRYRITPPENLIKVCDTLPSFRAIKEIEFQDFKLVTLARHFKIQEYLEHDALQDSVALQSLCRAFTIQQNVTLNDFLVSKSFLEFIDKARERQKQFQKK